MHTVGGGFSPLQRFWWFRRVISSTDVGSDFAMPLVKWSVRRTSKEKHGSQGTAEFRPSSELRREAHDSFTRTRAIEQQHSDIAHDLVSKVGHGRLLDVGTGPGRLLLEVQRLRPDIELFGFGG